MSERALAIVLVMAEGFAAYHVLRERLTIQEAESYWSGDWLGDIPDEEEVIVKS